MGQGLTLVAKTGKEEFINDDVSRIRAAIDLLIPVVASRLLRLAGPAAGAAERTALLTDPIWDLPAEGGGMKINGRWYTEHALERMAPDTPQIRAELQTRAINRLDKLGIKPDSPAYPQCFSKALEKIDPRGVPPSVVEAEISHPNSTNVRVITARRGQVVISLVKATCRTTVPGLIGPSTLIIPERRQPFLSMNSSQPFWCLKYEHALYFTTTPGTPAPSGS